MSEIKLCLLIIAAITLFMMTCATIFCVIYPTSAKDILVAAIAVGSSAITGILGWMGRGAYEALKNGADTKGGNAA
jgi:hypothetical protein